MGNLIKTIAAIAIIAAGIEFCVLMMDTQDKVNSYLDTHNCYIVSDSIVVSMQYAGKPIRSGDPLPSHTGFVCDGHPRTDAEVFR